MLGKSHMKFPVKVSLGTPDGYKPLLHSVLFCPMVNKKWRSTSNELSFSDICSTFS